MNQQQQFEILLTSLMSADNVVRGQAEQSYNQAKESQPNEVTQALLMVGRTSTVPELKPFSLILLRRALMNENSLWDKIDTNTKNLLKRELLKGIEQEENLSVRHQLCDATFELAGDLLDVDPNSWPELLEWSLNMTRSQMWHHRQSGLLMISHLSSYLVETFTQKFDTITNVLGAALNDPQNMKVRLAALEATSNFIHTFTNQPARHALQALLPSMLEVIANCLNAKDDESTVNALKLFVDLADLDPGFLKPNMQLFIDAMMKIAQVKELEDSIRQLAVEFLVTYVENKPAYSRTVQGFIPNLLNVLLHMMLEIKDISLAEWNAQEDNDDALDILNSVVAQENLDRVCLALNGESIVPDIFRPIYELLGNKQDWKCRHVALMALSMIGEGCYEYIAPSLDQVANLVFPLFLDEHPRVRWAAANAAGQMSTDFGPKFQRKYHAQIVPHFISLMDDAQNPKVQAHTAAAIINFCEKFDADMIVQYLQGLLGKLLGLMQCGNKMVQEQALTAIASIAGCAGKHFIPYYDTFVPLLKTILTTALHKDLRMLRGKAMECISLIGIAVGKEKFMEDAKQVMEILVTIQNGPLEADDPQTEFMLQAWTRISHCLGEDFIPYLKHVMPPLLKSAAINAGIRIQDSTMAAEEEEPGWEYYDVGEAKIAIHTSALGEKAQACNSIYCYASEMKAGFFPYVEEVSKLLVPLMSFFYHDGVRLASLSTMAMLLESTKLHLDKHPNQDRQILKELFNFIWPALITAVKEEKDTEVLVVAVEALHECLAVMGDNCLSPEGVDELLNLAKLLIMGTSNRRNELLKSNPDGDVDDSYIIREEVMKEDEINSEIAEVLGTLIKHHRQIFTSQFANIGPMVYQLAKRDSHPSERQLAICIFDDIIEYTFDQHYVGLFNDFIPLMLEYALDPHPGVRQASCFGLGVCAQHGGNLFKPLVPKTLEILMKVINAPGARENEKSAPPTENAVSSVGKIIQYQADVLGDQIGSLVTAWLSWLPIEVDVIEAKAVHAQLCHFIKSINALVFGPNGSNLPKVLNIFGKIVNTELVTSATQQVIKEILTQMSAQLPAELIQAAMMAIPPESQRNLLQLK